MMNYRNLVQFVGYEGPIHMNEDQFRLFWNPLSEPYMREGGVSKVILSQHRSGYFDFNKKLPYLYLSKNWWFAGCHTKKTFLSGRSGKIGHVSVNQLGIFQLRETKTKNSKTFNHLPHMPDKDILKLMGIVSVDQSNCDLSEPAMLGEKMSKLSGYLCHSIYELHPVAREYHTQKRRNKETPDTEKTPWMRCPCRIAGWIVEVYFNSKDVDTQGVCTAADQFYQNFRYWKFAFHKDQQLIDSSSTRSDSDVDPESEHSDQLFVSSI